MAGHVGGLEEPVHTTVSYGHRRESVRRPRPQFAERFHLVVAVGKLVEVDHRAGAHMRFEPVQDGGGARIQVRVHVHDELVVIRDDETGQRLVEPADLERHAAVVDLGWLARLKMPGVDARAPVLRQPLEAVESDKPRLGLAEIA